MNVFLNQETLWQNVHFLLRHTLDLKSWDKMLTKYLRLALRHLMRNKVYSFINIFGLALGVTCCLLLSLYIWDEMSYDKHHKRASDLYRIITNFQSGSVVDRVGSTSPPIAMTIKDEVPEVEAAVRILNPPGV